MKKLSLLSILCLGLLFMACQKETEEEESAQEQEQNQDPSGSSLTQLPAGDQTFTGNLSDGEMLSDLSWAWNSSMACFVATVENQYEGNHVFYQFDLPEQSTLDIYLTPDDPNAEIALYGFSKGAGSLAVPPDVTSCVSCEADPSNTNFPTTGDRHIYLNAITNPYSVIIGVAGSNGTTSGGYTIEIDVES